MNKSFLYKKVFDTIMAEEIKNQDIKIIVTKSPFHVGCTIRFLSDFCKKHMDLKVKNF